jgi:signal peptidase I
MSQSKPRQKKQTTQSNTQWIIENVISFGLAFLVVFMFRSSILEAFKIPSGSMIPTLLVGDHIFVNKFAYGLKIPFSDDLTNHPIFLLKRDQPKHGDIVVFKYPEDERIYYIKRVVGIPGDTIEVRNKILFINQKMISRDLIQDSSVEETLHAIDDGKYRLPNLELYQEHLDGVDHRIMIDKTSYHAENFGPMDIPEDHFFVMGDNRDFSNDSRFWGFVPRDNIKGKAVVIWWSLWVNFSESQFYFRPSRIGTLLR